MRRSEIYGSSKYNDSHGVERSRVLLMVLGVLRLDYILLSGYPLRQRMSLSMFDALWLSFL